MSDHDGGKSTDGTIKCAFPDRSCNIREKEKRRKVLRLGNEQLNTVVTDESLVIEVPTRASKQQAASSQSGLPRSKYFRSDWIR